MIGLFALTPNSLREWLREARYKPRRPVGLANTIVFDTPLTENFARKTQLLICFCALC